MCHEIDCGHGHSGHHGMREHRPYHWDCCCAPVHPFRHFPTREEVVTQLEEYLQSLKAEVKGVEERIAELKRGEA